MKIRIKRWVLVEKEKIEALEGKVAQLEKEKLELEKSYTEKGWQLLCEVSDVGKQRDIAIKEAETLNKKLDQLNEKAKAEKKELKDKIKELEKKLEESMSDKYIVRKVRATKSKPQTMNIKSSVKQSNAIKLVKEKL